ncbi:hypothetical protein Misp01_72010 [Microtetraspora sp. NBRC 13810]|uniref:VIT domain-containing protein n=1 Tax=Microtetraspora sp. NBRC 13810 TaxID=3030990 RepID=UPI0024A04C1C|nr:VIT domain-containing protein [Microtetraspora sp. NBRC 13810]GLW12073.1 hypothetical protein Misp01_72010 [Microtetraspora sp. NBRC 13810]
MTVPVIPLKADECVPLPDAGLGALATERGNLPLESVDVSARVAGLIAGVEVVQGFRNPCDVPLEATYVFPLPDRAAVTRFLMEADDRVVEGVLKERGQARADYDAAVAAGKRAAIAEEDRPDVFTIRVGNILPGEKVRIRLTLSQPLPYEDGAATFRFPLVVAPRYIPGLPIDGDQAGRGTAPDTDAVPDASRITPPVLLPGFPDPVRLSLAVDVEPAGLDLREMRSSLHVVTAEGTSVRLQPGERLDRDFILRLAFDASTSLVLAPDPDAAGTGTFALTVVPPAEEPARVPRDVVLLLDRSGSMGGWKMVAARRAAARIVDTLTTADRFAVLSFDHVVERPERLPEGLCEATDRNRYRAVEHLSRLEARGGTELLAPLQQGLALLGDSARERVLVLVTDGQVGNEDQILERAGAGLSGVRVHTVGIDRAVNAGFLGRLAGLGAGRCELVESEDRLDEAMEHIHRRIGAPLVTDLSLKAEGVDLLPDTITHLGSLFSGVPLTVSGRYHAPPAEEPAPRDDAPAGTAAGVTESGPGTSRAPEAVPDLGRASGAVPDLGQASGAVPDLGQASGAVPDLGRASGAAVTVRGLAGGGRPWERRVAGVASGNPAIRAIWARAHLRALEDRYATGDHALEQAIVDVSLRYGVLCRFTAFVAIDSRVVAEGGSKHHVIQPVEPPSGWDMPVAAPMALNAMTAASFHGTPAGFAAPAGFAPSAGEPAPESAPLGSAGALDAGSPGMPGSGGIPGAPGTGRTRSRPSRGPLFARRPGTPGASAPRPAVRHSLDTVRPQLAEELARLRAAESLPVTDRPALLADLGSRLAALAAHLGDQPELAALAGDLEAAERPGTDLDALWHRTVNLLTILTTGHPAPGVSGTGPGSGDAGTGSGTPGDRARRPFWKRS